MSKVYCNYLATYPDDCGKRWVSWHNVLWLNINDLAIPCKCPYHNEVSSIKPSCWGVKSGIMLMLVTGVKKMLDTSALIVKCGQHLGGEIYIRAQLIPRMMICCLFKNKQLLNKKRKTITDHPSLWWYMLGSIFCYIFAEYHTKIRLELPVYYGVLKYDFQYILDIFRTAILAIINSSTHNSLLYCGELWFTIDIRGKGTCFKHPTC